MKVWVAFLAVLGLGFFLGSPADAQSRSKSRAKVGELRRDLNAVQGKQREVRRELRQKRREAAAVQSDIGSLDARLTVLESDLRETTVRLAQERSEQRRVQRELEEATAELGRKREQLRQRRRVMYKRGEGSPISAMLGLRSVGDVATRKFVMERIAEADRELYDSVRRLQARVAARKREQDQLVRSIDGLVDRQRSQQDSLEGVKDEKEDTLRGLRRRQGELRTQLDQLEQAERQIESQIRRFLARPRPGRLPAFTGRFIRPVNAPITSGFGMRFHPVLRIRRMHAGVDFGAPTGTPIVAAADGEVIASAYMGGYGNTVILDHGGGYSTVYAHASRIYVAAGQRVRQGQRIAAVGSTGLSTGPHLHFEVRVNGRAVNPLGRL
jgi:murein DD-endopeptidase MepM/ murein hydrolase activator NlpD